MSLPPLRVLYEDNHCLAVFKPAGVLSTHFQGREETLDRQARAYLKEKYRKPGNVFLGVVHRLDRPVSGVLLFARTSKAAARLCEQFRTGIVNKLYWAVVEGEWSWPESRLEDWLLKDQDAARVRVVAAEAAGARHAVLECRVRARRDALTWLELRPKTGRGHQLRVQLAHRGYPIYGDFKYGGRQRLSGTLALHAHSLTFLHPIGRAPVTVTVAPPPTWNRFVSLVGGEDRHG